MVCSDSGGVYAVLLNKLINNGDRGSHMKIDDNTNHLHHELGLGVRVSPSKTVERKRQFNFFPSCRLGKERKLAQSLDSAVLNFHI